LIYEKARELGYSDKPVWWKQEAGDVFKDQGTLEREIHNKVIQQRREKEVNAERQRLKELAEREKKL
jgi:hypothetical protein